MKKIETPLTDTVIQTLHAGDEVALTGTIYTARDQAHRRLCEILKKKKNLPIDLLGQVLYYTGPTPPVKNKPFGSCGPTTSLRMDSFTMPLLEIGLKGMIGKGERSCNIEKALQEYSAVYFIAIGGIGALLSSYILDSRVVAFDDLGTESIKELSVKDFPLFVGNDSYGKSLFSSRDRDMKNRN
ncbi:FumA C-terminus/TtdB family hydratase beta subunit [Chlamydiota bacterium]